MILNIENYFNLINESLDKKYIYKNIFQLVKMGEIKKIHSYSVPCVIFVPVEGGNLEYMEWLNQSVG